MITVQQHFSTIAPRYRDLRITDNDSIEYIAARLAKRNSIIAAEIGWGCGRYTLKLFQHFREKLYLYCIDSNREMLKVLKKRLHTNGVRNFQVPQSYAEELPLADKTIDCIFSFNCIHHVRIPEFLVESKRVLIKNGMIFIYTRTRSQNMRNIWGRYFPMFAQKETRLYEIQELQEMINNIDGLKIADVQFFEYPRKMSLNRLLDKARNHHYSTFSLYNGSESICSLEKFRHNIEKNSRIKTIYFG